VGDIFNSLWDGARNAVRVASYFEMKNRAGVVGKDGLGPLLARLVPAEGRPRIHLIGHSFGARLVAFALAGLPADRRGATSPVKSLTLIQGAFSHFSFAQPMPIDAARNGALAAARNGVDGPLLATFSAADRAVGWWYPAASLLSHSDSESAQDLTYRWGAMGHDGYQQQDVTEITLQSAGKPYAFENVHFYRLDSNAVIAADQSPISGAHSDIQHPEILWAALAAALA
jgi:pimeloyl-ACP methyl ester carboxylesterase